MPPIKQVEEEDIIDRGDEFNPDDFDDLDEEDTDYESVIKEDSEDEEDLDEEDSEDEEDLDEEDSEDSEDSEDDEDDEDEVVTEPTKEDRIPKGRFNQVLKQRDSERERVHWLEEQLEKLISNNRGSEQSPSTATVEEYDYDAKETEYINLVLEGETSKAISLRKEIDNHKRSEIMSELNEAKEVSRSIAREVQEEEKFNVLVESFENKYSFLNADSDDYNEEAVDTVNAITANLIRKGLPKSQAIKDAVLRIAPMYEKVVKSTTTTKVTKKPVNTERDKVSKRRNIAASKSQPPKTRGSRVSDGGLDTVKVSRLNEKQFRELSLREKKILRGD